MQGNFSVFFKLHFELCGNAKGYIRFRDCSRNTEFNPLTRQILFLVVRIRAVYRPTGEEKGKPPRGGMTGIYYKKNTSSAFLQGCESVTIVAEKYCECVKRDSVKFLTEKSVDSISYSVFHRMSRSDKIFGAD